MPNFIRWNSSTHLYELSTDDGVTFTPLPLDGAVITEGTINIARLPSLTSLLAAVYPIGSIYTSVNSTNPGTSLGFGTWVAFGAGKVPVGFASGDSDFGTDEATGGEKTHALTTAELASHNHTQNAHNHTQDAHSHTYTPVAGLSGSGDTSGSAFSIKADGGSLNLTPVQVANSNSGTTNSTTATNQSTTATNNSAGSGTAHNNLQPFIVVRMWKRTA